LRIRYAIFLSPDKNIDFFVELSFSTVENDDEFRRRSTFGHL
jgi:hypothetical protein